MSKITAAIVAGVFGLLLTVAGVAASEDGETRPGGAFTCDFGLSSDPSLLPADKIAPSIERDRMYMAARPGLLHKHIPISFDNTGNVFSGGRYLFDTAQHAREYRDWVFNSYVLDGVHFLKRPYFLSPECHAWTVIGAHDFGDAHSSQIVLRTERWSLRNARQPAMALKQKFDAILETAQARGLTGVWLLSTTPRRRSPRSSILRDGSARAILVSRILPASARSPARRRSARYSTGRAGRAPSTVPNGP